jgi:hypothetical protein
MSEELPPNIQIISLKDMRQPTNLELAELILIQSQAVMAMVNYLMIGRDILSEDEELQDAAEELNDSMLMMNHWWIDLKPEVPGVDTDS